MSVGRGVLVAVDVRVAVWVSSTGVSLGAGVGVWVAVIVGGTAETVGFGVEMPVALGGIVVVVGDDIAACVGGAATIAIASVEVMRVVTVAFAVAMAVFCVELFTKTITVMMMPTNPIHSQPVLGTTENGRLFGCVVKVGVVFGRGGGIFALMVFFKSGTLR